MWLGRMMWLGLKRGVSHLYGTPKIDIFPVDQLAMRLILSCHAGDDSDGPASLFCSCVCLTGRSFKVFKEMPFFSLTRHVYGGLGHVLWKTEF